MSKKAIQQTEAFSLQDIQKCTSKACFTSKNDARDFLSRRHLTQTPYRCAICLKWHLTHYSNDQKAGVRETVRARMVQPSKITAKLRNPETFPVDTVVITPLGRLAKVVKHLRYDRSTPGRKLGVERLLCQYLDEPNKQFAIVWLRPENLRAA